MLINYLLSVKKYNKILRPLNFRAKIAPKHLLSTPTLISEEERQFIWTKRMHMSRNNHCSERVEVLPPIASLKEKLQMSTPLWIECQLYVEWRVLSMKTFNPIGQAQKLKWALLVD